MVIARGCKSGSCLPESQLLKIARCGDTACNPGTHETEAGQLARVRGQSVRHRSYKASLGYKVGPCLKMVKHFLAHRLE